MSAQGPPPTGPSIAPAVQLRARLSAALQWLSAALPWLGAAAGYLLMACVLAWPLPLHMGEAVWGDRFDAWTTLWLMGHLSQGGEMGLTDAILYPIGYDLWSFGHVGVQLLGLPLMAMGLSLTAAYNLLMLLSLAGSGLAAHALGKHLGGGHAAGLLAGALYGCAPMLYGEMAAGCLELVAAFMLPLVLLAALRLLDAPSWQRAAWLAAALTVTGPLNWYYLAFSALILIGLGSWRLSQGGRTLAPGLAWMAGACGLALALLSPQIHTARQETPERPALTQADLSAHATALARSVSDGTRPLSQLTQAELVQADSLQVLVNSTTLRDLLQAGFPANPLESTPGLLAWALGLWGLWAAGRRGRPWAAMALTFTLLSLGPYPRWDSTLPLAQWSQSWPLPYLGLYNHLPFFSKIYRPYRLGIVVVLGLSALAATGLSIRPKWRWLAPVVALLAATQPHWRGSSERPLASTQVSPAYHELAALPQGAVIELPLHHQPLSRATARQQFAQLTHGKPLLNCNQLIRRTDLWRFRAYVLQRPFLEQMLDRPRRRDALSLTAQDLSALTAEGFGYVVAHRGVPLDPQHLGTYSQDQAADRLLEPTWSMLAALLGEPVLEDAQGTQVYSLEGARAGAWPADWRALPDLDVSLQAGERLEISAAPTSMWVLVSSGAVHIDGQQISTPPQTWWRLSSRTGVTLQGPLQARVVGVQVLPMD